MEWVEAEKRVLSRAGDYVGRGARHVHRFFLKMKRTVAIELLEAASCQR